MNRKPVLNFFLILIPCICLNACMGSFNLTNSTYKWNKGVGSKFANEFVFFGLVIIPVYGVTLVLDSLVFNSIEFWGNKNPIEAKELIESEERQEYVTKRKVVFENEISVVN